jgi:hypothetical protein
MIQNRNLTRAANKRCFCHQIVNATEALQAKSFVDNDNDIKILGITYLYTVASDTEAHAAIEVGKVADYAYYLTAAGEDSKAIGYVKTQTVLNPTAVLPAGTALVVRRAVATTAAGSETIDVQVWYQVIDKTPQP